MERRELTEVRKGEKMERKERNIEESIWELTDRNKIGEDKSS